MALKRETFKSLCYFTVFAGFFIAASLVFFISLLPSIKKSWDYKETECTITNSFLNTTCLIVSDQCSIFNNDVVWYSNFGSSYFFADVSSGGPPNDEYSDDDDDDGGDDGGDGDDDGGDDGFGDGGGISIDGEEIVIDHLNRKLSKSTATGNGKFVNEINQWSPPPPPPPSQQKELMATINNISLKSIELSLKKEEKEEILTSSSSSSNSEVCSLTISGEIACYQGNQNVTYSNENGDSVNATVYGLWSQDYQWVNSYRDLKTNNSVISCYYNTKESNIVIWFKPPRFNDSAFWWFLALITVSLLVGGKRVFDLCIEHQHGRKTYTAIV